jgi:hypothetical protein
MPGRHSAVPGLQEGKCGQLINVRALPDARSRSGVNGEAGSSARVRYSRLDVAPVVAEDAGTMLDFGSRQPFDDLHWASTLGTVPKTSLI